MAAAATPNRIALSLHVTIALPHPASADPELQGCLTLIGRESPSGLTRLASPVDRNETASVMTVPLQRCGHGVMFLFAEHPDFAKRGDWTMPVGVVGRCYSQVLSICGGLRS